jgi:ribosomal protein L11 methyltransferase
LGARRVGARLILTPTWIEPEARPGDIVIAIDPQMAFGTGEHATTRGVLQLLEGVMLPGARVLDVGTGSAVLAIAAAKLGAGHVLAAESDPDALINAAENVARNGVEGTVELCEALVDGTWLEHRADPPFDLIVANVLSSVLRPLLPAFHAALRPAGALILSGILQEEADGMRASASGAGLALGAEVREEEWWTGLFRRL